MKQNRLEKKQNMIFIILASLVLALNVWKAFRGMGSADEHFYTTLGYRFAGSDGLFRDDWHIAQMISFFLEPLVKLYLSFQGSSEGIALFMRFGYTAFSLLCGIVFYLRFRSYRMAAVLAAVVWMLYTPFQIMALSYNTMSAGFVLLAVCAYPLEKDSKLRLILTGFLASMAVINTPYLALFYVFLTVLTVVKPELFPRRNWLYLTGGVVIAAVLFLFWLNGQTPLGEVIANLPHLIDPSHSGGIRQIARNIALLWRFFFLFLPVLLLEPFGAVIVKGKGEAIISNYRSIVLILNTLAMIYAGMINGYQSLLGGHGTLLFPFAVYGIVLLILFPEKRNSWPAAVFGISLFHSVMILCSSNVGPRTFVAPLILACAMTVLLEAEDMEAPGLPLASVLVLVFLLGYGKAMDVYDGSGSYDVKIKEGPLAGLYDSKEMVKQYEGSLSDLAVINDGEEENAMLVTWNCWEYLALNKRISTFSTYPYFWEKEQFAKAQQDYMNEHPDRAKGYVYLDHTGAPYDLTDDDPIFTDLTKIAVLTNGTLFAREETK